MYSFDIGRLKEGLNCLRIKPNKAKYRQISLHIDEISSIGDSKALEFQLASHFKTH